MARLRSLSLALVAAASVAHAAAAQDTIVPSRRFGFEPLRLIGTETDDRARLSQLLGESPTDGSLFRTASSASRRLSPASQIGRVRDWCELRVAPVTPSVDITWNSDLPSARNDGATWAGRGVTAHALAGARAECGRLRVQVAPEAWYAQNRAFGMVGVALPTRSGFTNPFFSTPDLSADLPLRMGNEPVFVLEPGQTSIEVDVPHLTLGAGTESQWWGPGIRNSLVMSNHAGGIPSFYLRTTNPISTPIGRAEARWIVGALTESRFFDFDESNDLRSLSGLALAVRMPFDTTLTLGGARVVYAPIPGSGALPARFLDAVARWGEGGNLREAREGRAAEQLATLFLRWVLPRSGFEAYAEWARVILPASLRSLAQAPQHSQGYTVGVQWISGPIGPAPAWRIEAEGTNLEQLLPSRVAPPPSFYASPVVPQGYTQRGQSIGALIGPGSSSQWFAIDRLLRQWRAGFFVGRTRWHNDAFYRAPTGLSVWAHDVSLLWGLRGGATALGMDLCGEFVVEQRLNYLFQSATQGFSPDRTFDAGNISLRIVASPRARGETR